VTSAALRSARHRPDDRGPAPFTADDFAARIARVASSAERAGLAGVLVAPGPDLLYLTGYAPVAITERLTILVVAPGPCAVSDSAWSMHLLDRAPRALISERQALASASSTERTQHRTHHARAAEHDRGLTVTGNGGERLNTTPHELRMVR
jgi:Xaa-Pro aminopeptidase